MNIKALANEIVDEIEAKGHYQGVWLGPAAGVCIVTSRAYTKSKWDESVALVGAMGLEMIVHANGGVRPSLTLWEFNDNNPTDVVINRLRSV